MHSVLGSIEVAWDPLRAGIELGASFIDTAELYGTGPVVGRAIRGTRDRIFLASKVSPRHFRRHDVMKAAECSLKQLNTDYLDLYQLHWPNYTFGLGTCLCLRFWTGWSISRCVAITILVGAFVSLAIELLQVILPTRDSSLADLVTNILWHRDRSRHGSDCQV